MSLEGGRAEAEEDGAGCPQVSRAIDGFKQNELNSLFLTLD